MCIQCCIDIAHRIIAVERAAQPADYYEAIVRLGEIGVLPCDVARRLAPMAGLRNVLVQEYVRLDWDRVYSSLGRIEELEQFADHVRRWLRHH